MTPAVRRLQNILCCYDLSDIEGTGYLCEQK
jgi:hypothetical protein